MGFYQFFCLYTTTNPYTPHQTTYFFNFFYSQLKNNLNYYQFFITTIFFLILFNKICVQMYVQRERRTERWIRDWYGEAQPQAEDDATAFDLIQLSSLFSLLLFQLLIRGTFVILIIHMGFSTLPSLGYFFASLEDIFT